MTFLDSQPSFSHRVAKLMEIKMIWIQTCLKCVVNDSDMLLNDSEMLFNDFEMVCLLF